MAERSWSATEYRFGFNGQEKVDDVSGAGNHTTAEFGEYDTRLGRRWNLDPKPNFSYSPYSVFSDNPIYNQDWALDTPSHTKQVGDCENCDIETLDEGDFFSDVQDQLYTATFENISQEKFAEFSKQMQLDPGKVINNNLAEYDLVDRDGSYGVSEGDHFDIDIWGPDNGSVLVDNVTVTDNSFSITVQTLQGHPDAGTNTFSASYDPKTKTMTWTTHNVSRTNDAMSFGIAAGIINARGIQQKQWKKVMIQVHNKMGRPKVQSAQAIVREYDYLIIGQTGQEEPDESFTEELLLSHR